MVKKPKESREMIYKMLDAELPDSIIRKQAKITDSQLLGYKAAYTRRENIIDVEVEEKIREYMGRKPGIYIPRKLIENNLSARQKSNLVQILNGASKQQQEKEEKIHNAKLRKEAPTAREIIIELFNSDADYEAIHNDRRLRGVSRTSIAAYLAHCTRGTYKKNNSRK